MRPLRQRRIARARCEQHKEEMKKQLRMLDRLTAYVSRPGTTAQASYGDILWALLNSSEFVLNH